MSILCSFEIHPSYYKGKGLGFTLELYDELILYIVFFEGYSVWGNLSLICKVDSFSSSYLPMGLGFSFKETLTQGLIIDSRKEMSGWKKEGNS